MHGRFSQTTRLFMMTAGALLPVAGCVDGDIEDLLDDVEIKIFDALDEDRLQSDDPRLIVADLPPTLDDDGDTIIINNNVTVVNNIHDDLIIAEIPNQTLLGFENLSFYDAYIEFTVDGELQSVFVYDEEALFLDYPCVCDVELVYEEYYDFDGFLVASNEIFDTFVQNGDTTLCGLLDFDDFRCGDAVIFTFPPLDQGIEVTVEAIDLID